MSLTPVDMLQLGLLVSNITKALWPMAVLIKKLEKRPLKDFQNGKTYVVCSSLYPMRVKRRGKLLYAPVMKQMNRKWRTIFPPSPLTGVMDAMALAQIGAWLAHQKISFELRIDSSVSEEERAENLILLGSPTSNRLTEETAKGIPSEKFTFTKDGILVVHEVNYAEGDCGIAIRRANPFNAKRRVLCFAGVGPLGTAAAADFCINRFAETASNDVRKSDSWLVLVRGKLKRGLGVESMVCSQECL